MLLEDLYTIKNQYAENYILTVSLVFHKNHFIYDGHFPDNPITPGVCLLQTSKELLEVHLKVALRLHTIIDMKFLKLIIPNDHKEITYTIKFKPHKKETKKMVFVSIKDDKENCYIKAKIIYTIL